MESRTGQTVTARDWMAGVPALCSHVGGLYGWVTDMWDQTVVAVERSQLSVS
jgi:hypothetical protein